MSLRRFVSIFPFLCQAKHLEYLIFLLNDSKKLATLVTNNTHIEQHVEDRQHDILMIF